MPSFRNLNCVKDVRFPVSYSLQSVDLRPSEGLEPGLVNVTLRLPGEIRILHGNDDLHTAVRKGVTSCLESSKDVEEEKATEVAETGEEKVALPQPVEKGGVWVWILGKEALRNKKGCLVACKVLESLICHGWEVVVSSELTTTPGFELINWVFKRSATPLSNGSVIAVACRSNHSLQVIGSEEHEQVEDALKQVLADTIPTQVKSLEPVDQNEEVEKERREVEKKEKVKAEQEEEVKSRDDLDELTQEKDKRGKCTKSFPINLGEDLTEEQVKVLRSRLLLNLTHSLFCRQWKFVASAGLPLDSDNDGGGSGSGSGSDITDDEVLFFCRDGRILPGLGQSSFAMIEIEKPDLLRLHNVQETTEKELKTALQDSWMAGLDSKEPEVICKAHQYQLLDDPWNKSYSSHEDATMSAQMVVYKFLLAMNKCEMNLYARVTFGRQQQDQRTLLIFRQSNVSYTEALVIKPIGLNRLAVLGGSESELECIRHALESRWPYPLTQDHKVEREDSHMADWWMFKVKRYPWVVSYGNKHLDRLIDATKSLLARSQQQQQQEQQQQQRQRQLSIPSPQNMDADSAKSFLVFLLKDLGDLGWRLQVSADVSSEKVTSQRLAVPERLSEPHTLFLLR